MSATSIGTEENSLGVSEARSRALIYMGEANMDKEVHHRLSKYSYRKGDGNQEADGVKVSINKSMVHKSVSYSK